eukprot:1160003-Pelagomonas_calceolata.AAC.6
MEGMGGLSKKSKPSTSLMPRALSCKHMYNKMPFSEQGNLLSTTYLCLMHSQSHPSERDRSIHLLPSLDASLVAHHDMDLKLMRPKGSYPADI